jgi:hypothetical protein
VDSSEAFLAPGHANCEPRDRPKEAGKAAELPLDKIHVDSPLFAPVHFDGQVPNPTLFPGFAQWGF